jgi:hypothetical protein
LACPQHDRLGENLRNADCPVGGHRRKSKVNLAGKRRRKALAPSLIGSNLAPLDLPAVEIAILKTPRDYQVLDNEHPNASGQPVSQKDQNLTPRQSEADSKAPETYQALRAEHAKATGQSASLQDQAPAPHQPETEKARSEQPSKPWEGMGDRVSEEMAAIERNKRLNPNAVIRQSARPDASANIPGDKATLQERHETREKLTGKEPLDADLRAAKESGHAAEKHAPERNTSAPEAAKQEKPSGKALLADDLNAAKEGGNEVDQSHDPGRSR